jgi:hypothetical protein
MTRIFPVLHGHFIDVHYSRILPSTRLELRIWNICSAPGELAGLRHIRFIWGHINKRNFETGDWRMNFRLAWATVFLLMLVEQPALADQEMKVFGHRVEVVGPFDDQKLIVDGTVLVKDAIVSIAKIDVVGGTGVLIGGASDGGNSCDISPFIVSFPAGKPPKVDGPIDECEMGNITIHSQNIEIVHLPSPNVPGHRRVWTPADGFKDVVSIPFESNNKLGWDALSRDLAFPIDLYQNSGVEAAIKTLTGPDDQAFVRGLSGPSKGEFLGDTYFGSGCAAHDCPFAGSFVIVNVAERKVFLAWKEDGKPFVVRPPVKDWPGPFRLRLKEWTQGFN